jgi:hypothetical protein
VSLEDQMNNLAAQLERVEVALNTLAAAMATLTATAAVEIEARAERPTIEVLKFGTDDHAAAVEAGGFAPVVKRGRGRPRGIREQYPRAICRSSCCGAEGRRMSPDDGRCFECRN